MTTEAQQKIAVSIEEEMKNSYMEYAMSVIVGRALPDVRDGLKPVHRRVLYAMYEAKNFYNQAFKKSARIVGDVIGKYHPHGDAAVYDTIVRMAQTFSMRYPLIDGQGNFGSVDGDPAAAMRYTEIRLAKIANTMLADIDKDTVDWQPNYDNSLKEPVVLPTRLPNLLVNGSSGIAVGMATNIPPHNLSEVIDATIHLIDNPEASIDDLINIVHGPDFPTAAIIYGTEGIIQAYRTGRGTVKMRARAIVEKNKRTGREAIVVTEIPYQQNKTKLIEKIANLIKEKKLDGISEIRDESDRDGMRIVLELKRDAVAGVIMNKLYKLTPMESSFGIIMLALVGGQPKLLNLKQVLQHFIEHRKVVVTRRTVFELDKARAREHILEGLKIALDHIDAVVETIKSSKTPQEARERLISRFSLSEKQAQAILDMRLQRLTGLEYQKIVDELEQIRALIKDLEEILASEQRLLEVIKDELLEVRREFGDERRTEIIAETRELTMEDLIVEEDVVVTVSYTGYIKRNAVSLYRAHRRGSRGKKGMGTKEDDIVTELFIASTHDQVLVFSDKGQCYSLKVYDIPQGGRASKGKAIVNLLQMSKDEKVAAIVPVKEFEEGKYIVFATKRGIVKRTALKLFANARAKGIIAIGINEGDELIEAKLTNGDNDILLATRNGLSIRFAETDVRSMGRTAAGVKGINLKPDDEVISMEVLRPGATVLTVTENGYGKRTSLDEYRRQSRGGTGIITLKVTEKTGPVVGVKQVTDDDHIMIITTEGTLLRIRVSELRIIGRNTQGVKLINLAPGNKVSSVAKLAERDDGNDDNDDSSHGEGLAISEEDEIEVASLNEGSTQQE